MTDTAHRSYPLVDPAAPQTTGAARINSALSLIDADVADMLAAILLKADADDISAALAALGTAATKNTGLAAGNVPLLDGSGKLDTSVIPALAISEPFPVSSQVAMLALTAQKGDIAIRSDLNKCFVLSTNSPSTLADWIELRTPTDAVLSVAGLTGSISAAALLSGLAAVGAATIASGALSVPATAAGGSSVKLFEDTDNGTNSVTLKAADALSADLTFTLPSADGTNGQVLKTNGSGVLVFGNAAGTPFADSTALAQVQSIALCF